MPVNILPNCFKRILFVNIRNGFDLKKIKTVSKACRRQLCTRQAFFIGGSCCCKQLREEYSHNLIIIIRFIPDLLGFSIYQLIICRLLIAHKLFSGKIKKHFLSKGILLQRKCFLFHKLQNENLLIDKLPYLHIF